MDARLKCTGIEGVLIASLRKNDGDGYENGSLAPHCIVLTPYCLTRQMCWQILLLQFNGSTYNYKEKGIEAKCHKDDPQTTVSEFRKKKVVVLCSRPPLSRRSRAVTVKKCTKSAMHVQIVVVLLILTYCFLPFSLPSPSTLLKLLNISCKYGPK